jgi:Ala-tRNA(Pro) deacylase
VTPQEQQVAARLDALGIAVERHGHPPVATVDDAEVHWAAIAATHCKNLFLRNQKGTRHYLVILLHTKRADLRAIADQIGDGKLSFASPERLMKYLGVAPGSVSPFGLINDVDHHVRVYLDRDLKSAARVSFHPNVNTATWVLSSSDFERFLSATGNPVRYVDVQRSSGD